MDCAALYEFWVMLSYLLEACTLTGTICFLPILILESCLLIGSKISFMSCIWPNLVDNSIYELTVNVTRASTPFFSQMKWQVTQVLNLGFCCDPLLKEKVMAFYFFQIWLPPWTNRQKRQNDSYRAPVSLFKSRQSNKRADKNVWYLSWKMCSRSCSWSWFKVGSSQ